MPEFLNIQVEIGPYSGQPLGPPTAERARIDQQLSLVESAANAAHQNGKTIADPKAIKDAVLAFVTKHGIRLRDIEQWRPVEPGTYTHHQFPYGPMTEGITDGVICHMARSTVEVHLANMEFIPDTVHNTRPPARPASEPKTRKERIKKPSDRIAPII